MLSSVVSRLCAIALAATAVHYAVISIPSKFLSRADKAMFNALRRRGVLESSSLPGNGRGAVGQEHRALDDVMTVPPACNCTCALSSSVDADERPYEGVAMISLDRALVEVLGQDASICVSAHQSLGMIMTTTAMCDETCEANTSNVPGEGDDNASEYDQGAVSDDEDDDEIDSGDQDNDDETSDDDDDDDDDKEENH
ncbi:expressed unknown protein [Seminavis robusta]|uniref:Uncharacterized protein n=1 Tax=Seminavis robusta TaxID=568900 RepID=A0A9N8EA40_9STRA|nr:expressed unknown protein [Seminavis robusta]|eukprot:Sro794_g203380.1 n/a (198) ;mRNA; f:16094-16791